MSLVPVRSRIAAPAVPDTGGLTVICRCQLLARAGDRLVGGQLAVGQTLHQPILQLGERRREAAGDRAFVLVRPAEAGAVCVMRNGLLAEERLEDSANVPVVECDLALLAAQAHRQRSVVLRGKE